MCLSETAFETIWIDDFWLCRRSRVHNLLRTGFHFQSVKAMNSEWFHLTLPATAQMRQINFIFFFCLVMKNNSETTEKSHNQFGNICRPATHNEKFTIKTRKSSLERRLSWNMLCLQSNHTHTDSNFLFFFRTFSCSNENYNLLSKRKSKFFPKKCSREGRIKFSKKHLANENALLTLCTRGLYCGKKKRKIILLFCQKYLFLFRCQWLALCMFSPINHQRKQRVDTERVREEKLIHFSLFLL